MSKRAHKRDSFFVIARGGLEAVQKPANTVRKEDAAFVKYWCIQIAPVYFLKLEMTFEEIDAEISAARAYRKRGSMK